MRKSGILLDLWRDFNKASVSYHSVNDERGFHRQKLTRVEHW